MAVTRQIRRRRIIIGGSIVGGLAAVGGVIYAASQQKAHAATEAPDSPGAQDKPKVKSEPPPKTSATTTTNIPSQSGKRPWNEEMFPNSTAVRAVLVGINPPAYSPGSGTPDGKDMATAVRRFQEHWNALAVMGKLPPNLNRTRLTEDGVPGEKFLRALEWAFHLNWAKRLGDSGIFP